MTTSPMESGMDRATAVGAAHLFVLHQDGSPQRDILVPSAGSLTLGRAGTNDVVIDHATLSSRHARIDAGPLGLAIFDLGSTNGTFVNGRRIEARALLEGDRIRMGNLDLVYVGRHVDGGSDSVSVVLSELLASRDPEGLAFRSEGVRSVSDPSALNLLFTIGRLAHRLPDEGRLIDDALRAIQRALRADRVVYQPMGGGPAAMHYAIAPGLEKRVPTIPSRALAEVQAGRTVLLRFDRPGDRIGMAQSISDQGIRSLLCVPVSTGEGILGSLYVDVVEADGPFDRRAAETLSAVADLLGAALGRIRAERRNREVERRLKDREYASLVGLLMSGIAHDLSNTLTSLLAHAQTAEEDARHRERLPSEVQRLGESGTRTVKSLLAAAGRSTERGMPFDCADLVADLSNLLLGGLRANGVRVETRIAPTQALVEGNAAEIQDAVLNLCLNAAHAMPEGGTLELDVSSSDGRVRIAVSDTGRGMTPDLVRHLFRDPVDPSGQNGFGIPLVRRVVEAHHGTIEVASEPGRGTRVQLSLPRANASETRIA